MAGSTANSSGKYKQMWHWVLNHREVSGESESLNWPLEVFGFLSFVHSENGRIFDPRFKFSDPAHSR